MVWVEGIRRNKTSKFSPGSPTEPTWVPAWVPAPCDQLAEGVGRCGGGGLNLQKPRLLAPKFSCNQESNQPWVEEN